MSKPTVRVLALLELLLRRSGEVLPKSPAQR